MSRLLIAIALAAPLTAAQAWAQDTDAATDAATATAAEPAAPRDVLLTLVNASGAMVMHFFVTPILPQPDTSAQTGENVPATDSAPVESGDLLAGGVISSGSNGILKVPGGADICTFNLRFELRDNRMVEASADICADSVFVIQ